MLVVPLLKVVLLLLPLQWLVENHPRSRFLPTPYQLKWEMSQRQLNGLSELLEVTERLRQSFEEEGDPRDRDRIARLREQEGQMKHQISDLKAFLAAPAPPDGAKIPRPQPPLKLPVRD